MFVPPSSGGFIHQRCDGCRRLRLHAGDHVGVLLEGERWCLVAETLRDHLDLNACLQRDGRVSVPQVMQSDPSQVRLGDETLEGL